MAAPAEIPELFNIGTLLTAGGGKLGAIVGGAVGVRLAFEVVKGSLFWAKLGMMVEPGFMRQARERAAWAKHSKGWADDWRHDLEVSRAERVYAEAEREYKMNGYFETLDGLPFEGDGRM